MIKRKIILYAFTFFVIFLSIIIFSCSLDQHQKKENKCFLPWCKSDFSRQCENKIRIFNPKEIKYQLQYSLLKLTCKLKNGKLESPYNRYIIHIDMALPQYYLPLCIYDEGKKCYSGKECSSKKCLIPIDKQIEDQLDNKNISNIGISNNLFGSCGSFNSISYSLCINDNRTLFDCQPKY